MEAWRRPGGSRRGVRAGAALAAGLALAAVWLATADLGGMRRRLAALEVRWIAAFCVLWLAGSLVRSLRWRAILARVARVPALECFGLFMGCNLINFLVPVRIGELVASLALKRNRDVPIARSLPTQILDRLFDLTPALPALALLLALAPRAGGPIVAVVALAAGLFTLLAGLVATAMARPALAAAALRLAGRLLPASLRPRLERAALPVVEGVAALRLPPLTVLALSGATLAAVALEAAALGTIFAGLGYAIDPSALLAGYTLMYLSSVLPRPPGNVGSQEVLFVLVFSVLLGVERSVADAAVLVVHVALAALLVTAGSLALFALGVRSLSTLRDQVASAGAGGTSGGAPS